MVELTMTKGVFKAMDKKLLKAEALISAQSSGGNDTIASKHFQKPIGDRVNDAIKDCYLLNRELLQAVDSLKALLRKFGGTKLPYMKESMDACVVSSKRACEQRKPQAKQERKEAAKTKRRTQAEIIWATRLQLESKE